MRIVLLVFTALFCTTAGPGLSTTLNAEQALEMARANSPELRAARLQVQSAQKAVAAAGLRMNPVLYLESEEIGWDNDWFGQGEYTIGVSQEFQRGGKQEQDRKVAAKSVELADQIVFEREILLREKVYRAFIDVRVQQEIQGVRSEQVELAREFSEVAQHRFEAGSNSELDVVQAELAHEETILLLTCCFGDLRAGQEKLASLMGITVAELPELVGPFYELGSMPELAVADEFPQLRRLAVQADRVRAAALRAKAIDTSNVSVGAGYRHEALGSIDSFLFSVSVPLGFNKQGRAEHAAGLLRADAVMAEHAESRRVLEVELASLLALYDGASIKVEQSRNKLIPKAKQAYEVSRQGYDRGLFSWLELIAAQQNLAQIRVNYIEYLHDAHLLRTKLSKFAKEGNQT